MGAILEPTPEMGSWRVEMRSRSAYLRGGELRARPLAEAVDAAGGSLNADGFAIRVADVANVLAALDQIIGHPSYTGPTTDAGWNTTELADGWLSLHADADNAGVYAYGLSDIVADWSPASEIELVYDDLHRVRQLLTHEVDREEERQFRAERFGTWTPEQ